MVHWPGSWDQCTGAVPPPHPSASAPGYSFSLVLKRRILTESKGANKPPSGRVPPPLPPTRGSQSLFTRGEGGRGAPHTVKSSAYKTSETPSSQSISSAEAKGQTGERGEREGGKKRRKETAAEGVAAPPMQARRGAGERLIYRL